jgi:hypothetical protein
MRDTLKRRRGGTRRSLTVGGLPEAERSSQLLAPSQVPHRHRQNDRLPGRNRARPVIFQIRNGPDSDNEGSGERKYHCGSWETPSGTIRSRVPE